MTLLDHFRMLAAYNRTANERLFDACSKLSLEELRANRQVSFGSIHGLLNHILLGDRIWLSRFEGGGAETPALNTILCDGFDELRAARIELDERLITFFAQADVGVLDRAIPYVNNQGRQYVEQASVAIAHFFNHQTHHRGQIHALLSQSNVSSPSLDLHRIINP